MSDSPHTPPPADGQVRSDPTEGTASSSAEPTCPACRRRITDAYFEVNGRRMCRTCREQLATLLGSGGRSTRMIKAAVFGLAAGVVGAGIYFAVLGLTGRGYPVIAVLAGLLVGGAVRAGSQARGGRGYQLLAVFITYSVIASTYVPLIVRNIDLMNADEAVSGLSGMTADAAPAANAGREMADDPAVSQTPPTPGGAWARAGVYGTAFVRALPLPVLHLSLVGTLIKGLALYVAFQANRRKPLTITGPYPLTVGQGAGASA